MVLVGVFANFTKYYFLTASFKFRPNLRLKNAPNKIKNVKYSIKIDNYNMHMIYNAKLDGGVRNNTRTTTQPECMI